MSMPASAPQKFSFDLDLGQTNQKTRVIGENELNELLAQAEKNGFTRGVSEGENSATNRAAAALAAATKKLADRTVEIAKTSDELQKQTLCTATELSISVGRKLAANLIARAPLGEIKSLIAECLTSLENVPHLVVRCHPDLAVAIEEEAKSQMQTSGFSGRLIVMGEPDIMLGDARLEWVDGGLVRDLNKMSDQIEERVSAFISANCAQTPSTHNSDAPAEPDANAQIITHTTET